MATLQNGDSSTVACKPGDITSPNAHCEYGGPLGVLGAQAMQQQ